MVHVNTTLKRLKLNKNGEIDMEVLKDISQLTKGCGVTFIKK